MKVLIMLPYPYHDQIMTENLSTVLPIFVKIITLLFPLSLMLVSLEDEIGAALKNLVSCSVFFAGVIVFDRL